jgi:ribulose-phosphate 3-epimerase
LLAVYPGPAGQKFLWPVLDKIKLLKKLKPEAIIEVDGGINFEVAKKCKEAGADILVSGTYIFSSNSVKEGIENLEGVA